MAHSPSGSRPGVVGKAPACCAGAPLTARLAVCSATPRRLGEWRAQAYAATSIAFRKQSSALAGTLSCPVPEVVPASHWTGERAGGGWRIGILGPVALAGGGPVQLGGAMERCLLAVLAQDLVIGRVNCSHAAEAGARKGCLAARPASRST